MNPSSTRTHKDTVQPVRTSKCVARFSEDWYAGNEATPKLVIIKSLIPSKDYLITPLLIYINLVIFLIMEVGSFPSVSPSDSNWIFFSNTFVHVSVIHLVVNMYGLYVIGRELEPLIGSIKFLGVYFFAAWLAAFNSILWNDMSLNSGTGGAIFGLYGCYIGLLIAKRVHDNNNRDAIFRTMIILVGYNMAIGFMGNFDTAANVGGLLYGALIGVLGGTILVQKKMAVYKSNL